MITKELLWRIRNELPMKLTIQRLGNFGPIAKQSDGYFRFQCPNCKVLRATVNPSSTLFLLQGELQQYRPNDDPGA